MERKAYDRPVTQVVKLQNQARLLYDSGVQASRDGYGEAVTSTWE